MAPRDIPISKSLWIVIFMCQLGLTMVPKYLNIISNVSVKCFLGDLTFK